MRSTARRIEACSSSSSPRASRSSAGRKPRFQATQARTEPMGAAEKIRALLLDLDGTIADTQELIFQCFSETFRRHVGRECSRPVWERSVGLPLEQMFAAAIEELGAPGPPPDLLTTHYREHLAEIDGTLTAFPEVPAVLAALRQAGLRLALVTSKHEP